MADTVLNTTVFDGSKKLITHYNVVSDGTGGTTKIVDVSELNSNNGKTCKTVRLNKISFNVMKCTDMNERFFAHGNS